MAKHNEEFQLRGINHLALVCRDMAKTVDFYSNVLGVKGSQVRILSARPERQRLPR